MESSRAIQVDQGVTYLPENDHPILLVAEGHELLNDRRHLLLSSNWVTCNNRDIAFQNVGDNRLARCREKVQFVCIEGKVGDRASTIEMYEARGRLSLLLIGKEPCCYWT